jgi:hypothetical protein
MISQAGRKAQAQGGVVRPDQLKAYTRALEIVYKGFLVIADPENEPAIIRAHYNLAEALVAQDKNGEAAVHYRWIFANGKASGKGPGEVNPIDAGLKAAAIEYENLKVAGVIPKDVTPKPLAAPGAAKPALNAGYLQWVAFVESIERFYRNYPPGHRIEFFRFEANRTLYAQGHVRDALEKMKPFIKRNPGGQFAVPTARLLVDTLVASQAWAECESTASELLKLQGWKDAQFQKNLYVTAADSSYKVAETLFDRKDFQGSVDKGKDFLAKFNASRRKEDVVSLIARAALELKNDRLAIDYLSTIIDEMPASRYFDKSLRLRASLEERRYDFAAASRDYRRYLGLPRERGLADKEASGIRGKIVLLTWLGGDKQDLAATLRDRSICVDGVAAACERFALYEAIGGDGQLAEVRFAVSPAHRGRRAPASAPSDEAETLRTLLELARKRNLSLDQRLERVQRVARGWGSIDPLVRFSLVGRLHDIVSEQFRHVRVEVREKSGIKPDPASIKRRVALIQKVERGALEIIKLPFARVQTRLLNEVASLYSDLAEDVKAIAAPAGLSEAEAKAYRETMEKVAAPFGETGRKLHARSFELASSAGVEPEVFQAVAEQYFADNAEGAKGLLVDGEYPAATAVGPRWLEHYDPQGAYGPLAADEQPDQGRRIRAEWSRALAEKAWPRVAFYLQEAVDRGAIAAGTVGIMRAISLGTIGARAESIAELEDAVAKIEPGQRPRFQAELMRLYLTTLARKKIAELAKVVPEDAINSEFDGAERKLVGAWSMQVDTAAAAPATARKPAQKAPEEGR